MQRQLLARPRWQPQFYDRVRTPRNRKVSCADNLYSGVLNLALQWIPLEIRVIGYFRLFDGRENIQWVLRIVQLALGKYDKRIGAVVLFFVCFMSCLMIRYFLCFSAPLKKRSFVYVIPDCVLYRGLLFNQSIFHTFLRRTMLKSRAKNKSQFFSLHCSIF